VDDLFSLYTDDFVYNHKVNGGTNTKEHLYNTIKNLKIGRYKGAEGRYSILNVIPGFNAAAVERLEIESGVKHLVMFAFKGLQASKIIEYWK